MKRIRVLRTAIVVRTLVLVSVALIEIIYSVKCRPGWGWLTLLTIGLLDLAIPAIYFFRAGRTVSPIRTSLIGIFLAFSRYRDLELWSHRQWPSPGSDPLVIGSTLGDAIAVGILWVVLSGIGSGIEYLRTGREAKKLLPLGVALLLTAAVYSVDYYFIGYPKSVAGAAISSIVIGQDMPSIFSPSSEFISHLSKNKGRLQTISFVTIQEETSPREIKRCATVFLRPDQAVILNLEYLGKTIWSGGVSQLSEALSRHRSELTRCTHVSATFMPSFLYRCTARVKYGHDLKVTGLPRPFCWD